MLNDIILETKLVADIKGAFYVPSYQRGYRWGEDEVNRLLDDVLTSSTNTTEATVKRPQCVTSQPEQGLPLPAFTVTFLL